MSASNWRQCPRCLEAARQLRASLAEQAAAAYGRVPAAEYERLRLAAAEEPEVGDHFREDYTIGVYQGKFSVSYRGLCQDCALEFRYRHEETVNLEAIQCQ